MAAYDVIPGGPSPEMNPGCSGPFIILDPETGCLYVWDSFAKEYLAYCLDETFSICTVPEYPLESDTLVFTCTPSRTPQEGKASIESLLQEFYSRLCAISGTGVSVEIVAQEGDPSTWCVKVSVDTSPYGGIVENVPDGYLEIDVCGILDAIIGDISDNDLCAIKTLGQYEGPGSECLTRNFAFGELTSRFIEAGSNIDIVYDPVTCRTTISSIDTTIDLGPGYGTEPGTDGKSVDLSICSATYFGAPPLGTRVLACVSGETVLVDYIEGGGAGDGIIVVSPGPGIDVDIAAGPGQDDITYTLSMDICDLPTVSRHEVSDAPDGSVFMPLCIEGESKKLVENDFHELVVTTVTGGTGVDVVERINPGGSSDFLVSLDLCALPDTSIQEIINAPDGTVYMSMCIDGNDKKLVDDAIHDFVGTTITDGQGVNVIESTNPSGSKNYIIDSDLCSLVTADIQEIINAPDGAVFIALCVSGVDKKVDSQDLLALSGTTVTAGDGIAVTETDNTNGSKNYEISNAISSGMPKVTVYTSVGSGTHIFEAGRTWYRIYITGGGGGGRSPIDSGGFAGGTAIKIAPIIGSSAVFNVAARGAAQGGHGGTSDWNDGSVNVGATGGPGASLSSAPQLGGRGYGGDINLRGGGMDGEQEGQPGASYWAGGSNTGYDPVGAYGCGGRGTGGETPTAGQAGVIMIEEYY